MARSMRLAHVNKNLDNKTKTESESAAGPFLAECYQWQEPEISLHSTELTATKNVLIFKENRENFPYFLARTTTGN